MTKDISIVDESGDNPKHIRFNFQTETSKSNHTDGVPRRSTRVSRRSSRKSIIPRKNLRQSLLLTQKSMKLHGKEAAINKAFDELDLDGNGQLCRMELLAFMDEALENANLKVEEEIIEVAIDALIKETVLQGQYKEPTEIDSISREHFLRIFHRHPDMLRVFAEPTKRQSVVVLANEAFGMEKKIDIDDTKEDLEIEKEAESQVWVRAKTHWKNRRVAIIWLCLYVMANVTAFTYKAVKYARHDEAQAVCGQCITIARGAAQVLNLNAMIILLPICRHFLTILRSTRLRFLFPFDATIELHMLVATVIAVFTMAHVAAHICDFYRFAHADQDDIINLLEGGNSNIDDEGIIPSEDVGERWSFILQTRAAITGIIMIICMIIAFPMVLYRRTRFNTFWVTHHLLLVMLVALCFHGTGNLFEHYQSIYWLMIPFLLYFIPRVIRETNISPRTATKIISISHKGGNVVGLRLTKPTSWENYQKSGMYAFLNIPKVSYMEWHPFTLTSCPHDEFIEFHIRRAGDWTGKLHDLLGSLSEDNTKKINDWASSSDSSDGRDEETSLDEEEDIPKEGPLTRRRDPSIHCKVNTNLMVKVEGPVGASSQGFKDYPVVVLVGAGIGITPMISVLKDLLIDPGKMQRTYLYWTARDRAAFDWFSSLTDEIYQDDKKNVLQIRHFLTSMKHDYRDLGSVLFHHMIRTLHKTSDFDVLLGRHIHHQVEVGRPNWMDELKSVKGEAKRLGHTDCGIFLCGPERMAEQIDSVSFDLSKEDPSFHFYFTKETF